MKKLYVLLIVLFVIQVQAQQDPQYTQYMYNMNVINPAYAGSSQSVSIGALYRSQWVGLDGAPSTGTLAVHAPVGERVGLGLSLINDEIGPVHETNAYVDFSYTLPAGEDTKLAFGLKGGATLHDIKTSDSEIVVTDPGDPFFGQNINSITPNIGVGVFFYKPSKYYITASLPNVLDSEHISVNGNKIGSESQHFFAGGGYVFDLSDDFKLKPNTLFKLAADAPLSFDANLNLFMYNVVEVGVGYRLEDSISGMINFLIAPHLRIGYAYDSINSNLNAFTKASHEIFVNFDISLPKKVSRSPRYF